MKRKKNRVDLDPKTGQPVIEEESRESLKTKHGLFFYFAVGLIYIPMMSIFKPRLRGVNNVPSKGGVVLAGNHASDLDALLIVTTARRKVIHFLAKSNLFHGPIAPFVRELGAIPVDRSRRNSGAVEMAVEKLKAGKPVAVFPEGTVNVEKDLREFRLGAVRMAKEAGVPVVPFAISGRYSITRRIWITYGEPFTVKGDLEKANAELMRRVEELRQEQRDSREPRQKKGWLQTALKPLLVFLIRLVYRPKVVGKKNIPKRGPTIVVANHKDDLDPFLIMSGRLGRKVHFLAKHECVDWNIGPLISWYGVIFVDRAAEDKSKVHKAVGNVLKEGRSIIALFPEGTRNKGPELLMPFKTGAVRYAQDYGATLVPAAIIGQYRPFKKGLKIVFGKPMTVKPDESLEKATGELYSSIEKMLLDNGEAKYRPLIYEQYVNKARKEEEAKNNGKT